MRTQCVRRKAQWFYILILPDTSDTTIYRDLMGRVSVNYNIHLFARG